MEKSRDSDIKVTIIEVVSNMACDSVTFRGEEKGRKEEGGGKN